MVHSRELELAARDFIDSRKPDLDIAERVEKYTNWDGELNEIVHYSKANVRGMDVLVNMVLSDFCGDTLDIETIFGPHYKYFGVRVFNHDLYDYCVCVIYAEEIYSSLKTALYTSSNIDEELEFERALLDKRIKEKHDYRYTEHYARDHPNARFDVYEANTYKTKRKVRLTNFDDDSRTFTVLRRNSLEREPDYKYHDDPDYQYTDQKNKKYTRVNEHDRLFKKDFNLNKGEFIVRQTVTDYDKEVYTKHNRHSRKEERPADLLRSAPKSYRFREEDSRLYYGDLNDVSRFEENVVDRYDSRPHIKRYRGTEKRIADRTSLNMTTPVHYEQQTYNVGMDESFRARPSTAKVLTTIHNVENYNQNPEINFRQEAPVVSNTQVSYSAPIRADNNRRSVINQSIRNTQRFSNVSAIPHVRDTNVSYRNQVHDYRMADREPEVSYMETRVAQNQTFASAEKIPFDIKDDSQNISIPFRSTKVTSGEKSKINPAYRMDTDSELS